MVSVMLKKCIYCTLVHHFRALLPFSGGPKMPCRPWLSLIQKYLATSDSDSSRVKIVDFFSKFSGYSTVHQSKPMSLHLDLPL